MSTKVISVIIAMLVSASVFSQVRPRPVPRPGNYGGYTIGVIYGQSDTCDMSKVEAIIKDNTDCRTLNSNRSWSIKVGQECRNITDTTVQTACLAIQTEHAPDAIYGQSDTCDMVKVISPINPWTDCRAFASERSWSAKINGVCQNITDTSGEMACRLIQFQNAPDVIFGQTDTCDMTKVEAAIDEDTDCDMLSSSARSWSVKMNGTCVNTTDTDVRNACIGMQSQNARTVVYGQTDTCDMAKAIVAISKRTDCSRLAEGSQRAWSAKINGVCQNITDTSVAQACLGIQSEMP